MASRELKPSKMRPPWSAHSCSSFTAVTAASTPASEAPVQRKPGRNRWTAATARNHSSKTFGKTSRRLRSPLTSNAAKPTSRNAYSAMATDDQETAHVDLVQPLVERLVV